MANWTPEELEVFRRTGKTPQQIAALPVDERGFVDEILQELRARKPARAARRTTRQTIDQFLERWGGHGAQDLGELRTWGEDRYTARLPEFRDDLKALSQRIQTSPKWLRRIAESQGPRHHTVFSAQQLDFSQGLPGFDPDRTRRQVTAVEADVERQLAGRDVQYPRPTLPGGRELTHDELNELNARMGKAWETNDVIDRLGKPTRLGPEGQLASPFYRVGDEAAAEGRGFMRVAVGRDALLNTQDPRLVFLTQGTFQDRPERAGLWGAGPSDVHPTSGTRPTYESVERLMRQRTAAGADAVSMIFDLETASLRPEHGIREISARFMNTAGEEVGEAINFQFMNGIMNLGAYGPKGPGGNIPQSQVAEKLAEFFERSNQADVIVGQNAMFDVNMLAQIKKDALFAEGARLIESGATPANAREQLAVRLHTAGTKFFERTQSDAFYDIAAHTRLLTSDVDGRALQIAPELLRKGELKQVSNANVLLQTSVLRDALELELTTPEAIRSQFVASALHTGDVDTFFEGLVYQVQQKIYGGMTHHADGRALFRPEALDDEVAAMIYRGADVAESAAGLRSLISSGRALTAFATHLDPEDLMDLEHRGILSESERLSAKITPLEQMMLLSRERGGRFTNKGDPDVLKVQGVWDEYVAKNKLLLEGGKLNPRGAFDDVEAFSEVQKKLAGANIPFANLSFMERALSAHMGRGEVQGLSEGVNQMRRVVGEVAGFGMWEAADQVRVFPRVGAGRSVAIPLELMEQMGLVQPDELFGISPFQFTRQGENVRNVALTVSAISKDKVQGGQQIRSIIEHLSGLNELEKTKFGITDDLLIRLEEGLEATGSISGIQVGTLGGARGSAASEAVYNLLEDIDATVDRARPSFLLGRMGEVDVGEGDAARRYIETTPFLSNAGDTISRDAERAQVREQVGRLKTMTAKMNESIAGDPRVLAELGEKAHVGSKAADVMPNIYNKMRGHLTGRRLAIGAAAAIGSAVLYKSTRPKPGEETMHQQPFEDANFYDRYRQEMGQPYREPVPIIGRHPDPLGTAKLPGYLHDKRTNHTQMGNSKNDHLYQGAY